MRLEILLVVASVLASPQLAQTDEPSGKSAPLALKETEEKISIEENGTVVLTYNKKSPPAPPGIKTIYERSGCLHPIGSPKGRVVTQMFPADHAHQHGFFSAWVNTTYNGEKVDFWNLAGGSGRVLHERVASRFDEKERTGFEVDLLHRAVGEPAVDVLRERWKVTAYPTDGTYHCFDLETKQTALTDKPLIINQYHYGGLALRGRIRWLTDKDSYAKKHPQLRREPSAFLNDLGSDRKKGNHEKAKWVALAGKIEGNPVSIAVLSHKDNFRAPQTARLHPTKPYFCFAPCVEGQFVIDREHPYQARYRFLITDAQPAADWLDQEWQNWCGSED